jgi:hypothetical protein
VIILPCRTADFSRNNIQPTTTDQQLAGPVQASRRKSLSKFHPTRINRLHVSQNAAALLFDLGTIDIRRVGTHQSEYSLWGVPSKDRSVVGPLQATMNRAR